jgi:hypothetical protein
MAETPSAAAPRIAATIVEASRVRFKGISFRRQRRGQPVM